MSLPDKSAGSGRFEAARYRFLPVPFSDMTTSQGSVPTRLGSLVGSSIIIFYCWVWRWKKIWKSIVNIWGSYGQKCSLFLDSLCTCTYTDLFTARCYA